MGSSNSQQAGGKKVVTATEVLSCCSHPPVLKIRLRFPEGAKRFLSVFYQAETETQLLHQNSELAYRENENRIQQMFNKIRIQIDDLRNQAMRAYDKMNPEQQEQLIEFWEASSEFVIQVFEWLRQMFHHVLDKIKQGFCINRQELRKLFDEALKPMKDMIEGGLIPPNQRSLPPLPQSFQGNISQLNLQNSQSRSQQDNLQPTNDQDTSFQNTHP
jgi:hypothetical protein